MTTLKQLKIEFEERFHQKWTSLAVLYHYKAIISQLTGIPFNQVVFHLEDSLDEGKVTLFKSHIERLDVDEPLQHIVGETDFMGYKIICSPDALIPRPETEELVEWILSKIDTEKDTKILDLCTGTGCIAIALAKLAPRASLFGIDLFDRTLELAKLNGQQNQVSIEWSQVDVLSELEMKPFQTNDFTAWVSNPPYIPNQEKSDMAENVLLFEPHDALFVPDNNPLLFYRKIADLAQSGLQKGGWLFFEIHENFGKEMIALLQEFNFTNISLEQDMQGKDRIIYGQK